jgi:hypothetical protein
MPSPASRLLLIGLMGAAACSSGDGFVDPGSATPSRAFGIWTPGPNDGCTKEQHDAFAVLGPDGKVYPTWHPPTGPGGCTFGHEHGRDPRGSDLYGDAGGLPFGHANEMLAIADPANPRDEDHVGHKVEWQNDMQLQFSGAGSAIFTMECDVLTKLHQGTHSKDAFTNNVHELIYHFECQDGTEMHVTMLTAIGTPGEFRRSCDRDVHITAGAPVPANSPDGGGFRAIPDRVCIEQYMLVPPGQQSNCHAALHETWETSNNIRRADGRTLASFNPYFQVRLPSRFHDPALAPVVGRPIDVCYEVTEAASAPAAAPATSSTDDGQATGVTYDDPARASMVRDTSSTSTATGWTTRMDRSWYTDAYGRNGQTAIPGSIRQRLAAIDNFIGVDAGGPTIGTTGSTQRWGAGAQLGLVAAAHAADPPGSGGAG